MNKGEEKQDSPDIEPKTAEQEIVEALKDMKLDIYFTLIYLSKL